VGRAAHVREGAGDVTVVPDALPSRLRTSPWGLVRRPTHVVERNARFYRHSWFLVVTGALEPLMYLLSARVGIGELVGRVELPGGGSVAYDAFVAPALLAASAANGVIYDTTFNFFHKLRFAKAYDAMLATPMAVRDVSLGELMWALVRGLVHAVMFVAVMGALGLLRSWWALLALPAVLVIGWGFAGLGLAATTYVRTWRDFDWQQLIWLPMFVLSASFFPLSVYPDAVQWLVRLSPLYQGVALMRMLLLGDVDATALLHVAYLLLMGALALRHATRRMSRLLLH
jgi:lipooligosaccharide transport system permease protein